MNEIEKLKNRMLSDENAIVSIVSSEGSGMSYASLWIANYLKQAVFGSEKEGRLNSEGEYPSAFYPPPSEKPKVEKDC